MSVFDRWNVGNLRAVAASMPDTATILRTTPTSTPGGWSQAYASVGTTKCRVVGMNPSGEVAAAAELASVTRYRMECPNTTFLQLTDRVTVIGKTFEVIGNSEKSWNVTNTYYLAEVKRI